MARPLTLLVLLLAGRAAAEPGAGPPAAQPADAGTARATAVAEPAVVSLVAAEGPFATAFDDKCRSIGDVKCRRIASARTAPFERVELHEAAGGAHVVIQHAGQWFVGAQLGIGAVSDPTTSQRVSVTFVRFSTVDMPKLGKVAVIRVGTHVTLRTHCSRHAAGCEPGAPDYKARVDGEYDDDAFVVCSIAGEGPPRCTPPIVVPEELVQRTPFTEAALVLRPACKRFDWRAHRRAYDHAVPSPCRYEIAAP